jgi:predicted membrane GTPase involved in stress response
VRADAVPKQLPVLTVDEPTISMTFQVNNSPFAGRRNIQRRQVPDLVASCATA